MDEKEKQMERRRLQSKKEEAAITQATAAHQLRRAESKSVNRQFAIYELQGRQMPIKNIFDAAEAGDHRAVLKFSKDAAFDADAKDRYGRTPLIWAADCSHFKICEDLIRLGASINAQDSHTGRTALHWAARAGSLPIVRLLVQFGGKINKEDKYGLTPLYLARTKGAEGEEVFKYLLSEGAAFNEHKLVNIQEVEAQIQAELEARRAADSAAEGSEQTGSQQPERQ